MNRELWNYGLMLAVGAPFIYVLSEKQKNVYFKLGLKLIAGAVVVKALPPILAEIQPLYQAAQEMKAKQEALAEKEKAKTFDGEAVAAS